ncbi:SCO family protein [Jatrophihabitans fulvus]
MKRVLFLLVAVVALVAGCSSSGDPAPKSSELIGNSGDGTYLGAGLTPPQPRPSFTLTDTAGKKFAFGTATSGRPTLLFFGYTNCPDVCPTTMADVQAALQKVPASVAAKTDVVFVTTDVKRDKPSVLKKWLSNFSPKTQGARFIGLTGTQTEIDAAQAAAHITVAEDNGQTHSSQLLLYGPDDYARVTFLQSVNLSKQVAHDLPVVAKA